jgi:serine phosphatase RsbU (regulator of sigma subunit)
MPAPHNRAVRQVPATEGASVCGDWYDAFPLADGRVGLVIGDVPANIASASTMGQVRSLLHAYAIDDPDPGGALQRTHAPVAQLLSDALATVVYAVLDPATGDLPTRTPGTPRRSSPPAPAWPSTSTACQASC